MPSCAFSNEEREQGGRTLELFGFLPLEWPRSYAFAFQPLGLGSIGYAKGAQVAGSLGAHQAAMLLHSTINRLGVVSLWWAQASEPARCTQPPSQKGVPTNECGFTASRQLRRNNSTPPSQKGGPPAGGAPPGCSAQAEPDNPSATRGHPVQAEGLPTNEWGPNCHAPGAALAGRCGGWKPTIRPNPTRALCSANNNQPFGGSGEIRCQGTPCKWRAQDKGTGRHLLPVGLPVLLASAG